MRNKSFFFFLSISLFISSCEPDTEKIDLSQVHVSLSVKRLEQDLFENKQDSLVNKIEFIKEKYGEFFNIYTQGVLQIGTSDQAAFVHNLHNFITDPDIVEANKEVQKKFRDFSKHEEELTQAFRYFKYYFPDSIIPEIVTNISGFNYEVISSDKTLALGLEMFMGDDFIYYQMLALPQYKIRFMKPSSLCHKAMRGWITSMYEYQPTENDNLLSQMIYLGKIQYCLSKTLPETPDSVRLDYTSAQMDFVNTNESNIWSHFIEQELLFTSDHKKIMKYTNEGPFTSGMPQNSPARLAEFIGYKIVSKFMENSPKTSLPDLMNIKDAQEILNKSKYKPDR